MATRLQPADREFFRLVVRAAFCNPFSPERVDLDRQIGRTDESQPRLKVLARCCQEIEERLHKLAGGRPGLISRMGEADREVVTGAVLFTAFHRVTGDLDRLTRAQAEAGASLVRVGFARSLCADLAGWGIPLADAHGYLAMFYQLRRAYYFIVQRLVGSSPGMRELRMHLWRNVFSHDIDLYRRYLRDRMEDFPVLFLGETGSGKGAAAAAVGQSGYIPYDPDRGVFGESFMSAFLPVNLSEFSASLVESELFGHRKGAFTGAVDHHTGVLGRCSPHGAVFLDEIGDVAPAVQIKLLRVLQEREFTPVGGHEARPFRGRVLAATHQDLHKLRRSGQFRDDFYYRLCSDVVEVPPLRQRLAEDPQELARMVEHLLGRLVGPQGRDLAPMVLDRLEEGIGPRYPWPGNVRELEQAVRRVILTGTCAREGLPFPDPDTGLDADEPSATLLLQRYCRRLYDRHGTYQEVARRTGLDRRTVKKHIDSVLSQNDSGPGRR